MTDYVRAYDNPTNVYYREARKLADSLRTDAYLERDASGISNGILRWKSNDKVVPEDCADLAYIIGISVNRPKMNRVRDRELKVFLDGYRKAREKTPMTDEERFEARAAFGPGAKIVNIITGQEFTT